jgi:hypothetical protein
MLSPGSCRKGGRFYLVCREKDFVLDQELGITRYLSNFPVRYEKRSNLPEISNKFEPTECKQRGRFKRLFLIASPPRATST